MQQAFIVLFHDQADAECACRNGIQSAGGNPGADPAAAKQQGRSAVLKALQSTADSTRASLKPFIDQLVADGHISRCRHFFIINAMAVMASQAAVAALAQHPAVASVLPDRVLKLHPDTPGRGAAATVGPAWGVSHIGAPDVWSLGYDGTGTVVGIIDTGVDFFHPDLQRQFRGYDKTHPFRPATAGHWFDAVAGRTGAPYDDNYHGTHVTGTILGSGRPRSVQSGVAPGARWIAAKAFDKDGAARSSWLLAAGEWMLAPRDAGGVPHPEWAPDVVNCSWGGEPGLDEWYRPMVTNWRAAGIFPVFAAGNNGPDPHTVTAPGNYPETFAVGAIDRAGAVAGFSARGPSPYGEVKPELSAPGVDIRSTMPRGRYGDMSGTSMAAPHVAGTVALMLSARPDLSVEALETTLLQTAVPLTDSANPDTPNNGYGHGLVNALAAVRALLGPEA